MCGTKNCDEPAYCKGLCRRCYMRQYRAANRDRRRELNRRWEEANRKTVNARRRAAYQRDPERRLEANRRSAARNREAALERGKRYYAENREEIQRKARIARLTKTYGLGPNGYETLLELQDGRCGICGTDEPVGGLFMVDHDHDTGAVRGLLCRKCNTGIGQFGDDEQTVLAAARWLESAGDSEYARTGAAVAR